MSEVDDFIDGLLHYGTKGMKWGQRKADRGGASRKTNRTAKKDADEFARAKQFYGEGAGTRRKLIKATVEARSKHDPLYKQQFDKHLSRQDLAKRSSQAVSERKRKDRSKKTKQSAGFVARKLTGEMGTTAAFTAASIAGLAFLGSPKGQAFMGQSGATVRNIRDSQAQKAGAKRMKKFLSDSGF